MTDQTREAIECAVKEFDVDANHAVSAARMLRTLHAGGDIDIDTLLRLLGEGRAAAGNANYALREAILCMRADAAGGDR